MTAVSPWPSPPVPEGGRSTWLLSLVDTLSLLLCFFILIYAMGTPDAQRFRDIASSLSQHLPTSGIRAFEPPAPPARQAPTLPAEFALNLDYLTSLIEGRTEQLPVLSSMAVERHFDRLVLIPPSDVAFASGSTLLLPGAGPVLGAVADLLAHVPNRLQVQAAIGADGSWETAIARAQAVVEALKRSGYPGEPVALAGAQAAPLALMLLPTAGGRR